MAEEELHGPVPFGIREDGSLLDSVADDALLTAPQWPLDEDAMAAKASEHKGKLGPDHTQSDPNNLQHMGWAILYGKGVGEDIKEALRPLVEHRRKQVGNDALFKEKEFDGTYKQRQTAREWLRDRNPKIDLRTVVPKKGVPYYVLIVASPEMIPFEFQYQLDLVWAVGRIWFPTAAEFAQYAKSVVDYETAPRPPTSRQLAFFAPSNHTVKNKRDMATYLFNKEVVEPLLNGDEFTQKIGQTDNGDLQFRIFSPYVGDNGLKTGLEKIFRGDIPDGPPALLFSGSHGLAANIADPLLPQRMGALVCQERIMGSGRVTRDEIFRGDDVPSDARVHGMIHFLFACYGAGWPKDDNFSRMNRKPAPVAYTPGLSRLPQKLLAHPRGGALAVLGHIDRAWAWSFESENGAPQNQDFRMVLNGLMAGNRIGEATDRFNSNWSLYCEEIAPKLQAAQTKGRKLSRKALEDLRHAWVARDDARNYIVFGDPAVRLRVDTRYGPPELEAMPVLA